MTERIKIFKGSANNITALENEIQRFLKTEREKYGEIEIRESGIAIYGDTIVFYIRYRTR
jgi:hypothetical protein